MFTKDLVIKLWYRGVFGILKIGYARVSTGLQNLNLQEDRLNTHGCEKIFNDHMSGSKVKDLV